MASGKRKIMELMDAVDSYIPETTRDVDKDFLMPVEDVFSITGRGTVATGRIETGVINTGEEVEIVGIKAEKLKLLVTGVEMFRKILDEGEAGDNVGLLLRGIEKRHSREVWLSVSQVQLLHTQSSKLRFISLKKEEGGRHTPFHKVTVLSSTSEQQT